jgi:hypothetical protein
MWAKVSGWGPVRRRRGFGKDEAQGRDVFDSGTGYPARDWIAVSANV